MDLSRGRWRLTVHRRDYSGTATPASTGIAELVGARSRKLETKANGAATLTFTMDGRDPACAYIEELTTDVLAWRAGDDGVDHLMGRTIVAQSEDQVADYHTVNVTCHDYFAPLARRYLTAPADLIYTQTDQDDIVADLLSRTVNAHAADGTSLAPGSHLPLAVALVNPDGTPRGKSGILRDRTYSGGSSIGQLISDLSAVIGATPGTTAFDFDVHPTTGGADQLRIFYGAQGVGRSDIVLAYGATVSGFTRSITSADYGNYQRWIGDNQGAGEGAPQMIAEAWSPDANNVGAVPIGLWMSTANASDVSDPNTLSQQVHGALVDSSLLIPSYSLTMTPGAPIPNMGDTVPLVLKTGRLDVTTTVRVVGITYDISDDDTEDVTLTVGRPALELTALFTETARDVDALARR